MTDAIYEYVVERFAAPERELLKKMAKRARDAELPMIMIAEDQARFLGLLIQVANVKRVLDVGTLFGYSAAIMAHAMGPKGRVVTLELEPRNADVARENFEALGIDKQIAIHVGPAKTSMANLKPGSFDLVLIDADKEGYIDYFEAALNLIRDGGLIAADNALAWGRVAEPATRLRTETDVLAIQRFNDHVAKRRDVTASMLPLGDGLLLARKKG